MRKKKSPMYVRCILFAVSFKWLVVISIFFSGASAFADRPPCIKIRQIGSEVIPELAQIRSKYGAATFLGVRGEVTEPDIELCPRKSNDQELKFVSVGQVRLYQTPINIGGFLCKSSVEDYELKDGKWVMVFPRETGYAAFLPVKGRCEFGSVDDLVDISGLIEDYTLSTLLAAEDTIYYEYVKAENPRHKLLKLKAIWLEWEDNRTYYVFNYPARDGHNHLFVSSGLSGFHYFRNSLVM